MRGNIVIVGVAISIIAFLMTIFGLVATNYYESLSFQASWMGGPKGAHQNEITMASSIGRLGIILLFIGIPMAIIGGVLKSKKQKEIVLTFNCPKCGREISFETIVCPYCKYDL